MSKIEASLAFKVIILLTKFMFVSLSSGSKRGTSSQDVGEASSSVSQDTQLSMKDIIIQYILNEERGKFRIPLLARQYSSVKEFLQAVIQDPDEYRRLVATSASNKFTDLFYLIPYRKHRTQNPPYDLNVLRVWEEDRNFGDDIKIVILSDGVALDHPDISENLYYGIAFDYVEVVPLIANEYSHAGTKAAGLLAMKLNGVCGIGIAPKAKIGVRLIDQNNNVNFKKMFASIKYLAEDSDTDIVLDTWLPTYRKISQPINRYRLYGGYELYTAKGRQGKGLIHVVPIGGHTDAVGIGVLGCARNVNVNSIYTIPVAATEYDGRKSQSSTSCAAVMVTAYSTDGNINPQYKMRTINANGRCTDEYKGTSAAASLVVGILALVLRANPNLTFRDVQHLITWTSEVAPIKEQQNNVWNKNKAGFFISNSYGFGMINAYNMIQVAKVFQPVPPSYECQETVSFVKSVSAPPLYDEIDIDVYELNLSDSCEINYIEHILLVVSIGNRNAGMLDINLTSPQGTSTDILKYEENENRYGDSMLNWAFNSVMTWGERPQGIWKISIKDRLMVPQRYRRFIEKAQFCKIFLSLAVFGTKEPPLHYRIDESGMKYRSYIEPFPHIHEPETTRQFSVTTYSDTSTSTN